MEKGIVTPAEATTSNMLSVIEACELINVGRSTLYKWEHDGIITPYRTTGGHRRYIKEELLQINKRPRYLRMFTVGYCRVSSSEQKEELNKQKFCYLEKLISFQEFKISLDKGTYR
jgi:excisionase family DNA binding protein